MPFAPGRYLTEFTEEMTRFNGFYIPRRRENQTNRRQTLLLRKNTDDWDVGSATSALDGRPLDITR
jgi:hypothetical protein